MLGQLVIESHSPAVFSRSKSEEQNVVWESNCKTVLLVHRNDIKQFVGYLEAQSHTQRHRGTEAHRGTRSTEAHRGTRQTGTVAYKDARRGDTKGHRGTQRRHSSCGTKEGRGTRHTKAQRGTERAEAHRGAEAHSCEQEEH
jgi:hypothetical protein